MSFFNCFIYNNLKSIKYHFYDLQYLFYFCSENKSYKYYTTGKEIIKTFARWKLIKTDFLTW